MPSDYGTIIIAASHSRINIIKNQLITSSSVNSIKIRFDFRTSDWDEMSKTAVFWNTRDYSEDNDDTQITVVLDNNNECFIPHEIIDQRGNFMVGVYGVHAEKRLPTNFLEFEIDQGCYMDEVCGAEPTPDIYAQLMELIKSKIDTVFVNGVAQTINNGQVYIFVPKSLYDINGYDSSKIQVLKNINGTIQWINDE